jgi:hypothetical protein
MAPDGEADATELARIDADLVQLNTHVNTWLQDRFLSSEDAAGLNIDDVAGLVAWLRQWHTHFDAYSGSEDPAVLARLAQIRIEIDNSIATFTEMAASLPDHPEG